MLIHQYDNHNGQYHSSRLADADPRHPDRWLMPAFSTAETMPERTALTWPFYVDGTWTLLPDYRGRILYRQDTGEAAEILVAGQTPAEHGLTETPRPSDDHTWRDGEWKIDPAMIAQKERAAAMAEFERRMTLARAKNAGKADAYAAGLLSLEEAYGFRAWSSYQIALVRAIEQTGFPDTLTWPAEPATFTDASAAAMTVFDARMAIALGHTAGKADAYAAGELSAEEAQRFRAWSAYQDALQRVITKTGFPDAIAWPVAPDSTIV
jgi:hypothetical protein